MSITEVKLFNITMPDSNWSVEIRRYGNNVIRVDLFWGDKETPTHSRLLSEEDSLKFREFMGFGEIHD